MRLKYAKALNGEFAICPRCKRIMAKNHCLNAHYWVCLLGCGLKIKEQN